MRDLRATRQQLVDWHIALSPLKNEETPRALADDPLALPCTPLPHPSGPLGTILWNDFETDSRKWFLARPDISNRFNMAAGLEAKVAKSPQTPVDNSKSLEHLKMVKSL